MSAYAEYKHAKTEEEREEALKGIRSEVEHDRYWEDMYERESDDDDDNDGWGYGDYE